MPKSLDHSNNSPTNRRDFLKLGAGVGALALAGITPQNEAMAQTAAAKPRTIDAHAHWVLQAYAGRPPHAKLGRPTTSIHTPMELDSNLEQRLKWMDE